MGHFFRVLLWFCPIEYDLLASMRHFFPFFNAFCPIAAFYGTVFCGFVAVLSHRIRFACFYETLF
ncbi:hypothetical protein V6C20_00475, partial [Caldibacillus thermoamylovorans]